MNINWFPGHMKKTYDELIKNLDKYDFVIQVLDARAIEASSNPELLQLFDNKPIITVVMKQDLSDHKITDPNLIVYKNPNQLKKAVILKLEKLFNQKESYYKPLRTGIVVGLPNIGKSTLINKLINKNNLQVLDKPGTTKRIAIQKISEQFFLYDSPGVMLKKIENQLNGYVLCLIGCISAKVVNLYDLMAFAITFLKNNYSEIYYGLTNQQDLAYDDLLSYLGKKWNFLSNKNEINTTLVLEKLYNLFHTGKIGKLNFDAYDLTNCLIKNN